MHQNFDSSRLWQIHGRYYDLEPFLDLHPGGRRLLEQLRGMDATVVFESTHVRDKMPKAMLAKYYVADVPEYASAYDWKDDGFFPTLKRRVREALESEAKGLTGQKVRRLFHGTEGFKLRFALLWLTWIGLSVGAIGFGSYLCAVLWAPFAFALGGYGHEAMHNGMFVSSKWNRAVSFATVDLMGLSSFVFTGVHVPLHHVDTNVPGKDPDIEVHFPMIRERPGQPLHWYNRMQHIYAWVLYAITFQVSFFADIVAAITGTWFGPYAKIRKPSPREWALLLVSKAFAFTLWYALPFILLPLKTALIVHLLTIGFAGIIVQATFACSHQNAFAMNLDRRTSRHPRDWGSLQLETTIDFQHGHWFPTTFFGGLGYQIEHHLFPTLSYSRLNLIAPIVRKTCDEFGVPYCYYKTGFHAYLAHFLFLKRMGRKEASVSASDGGALAAG